MKFNYHNFKNYGFLLGEFTEEELAPLKLEINKIKSDFNSAVLHNTAEYGNVKKEYSLFDSKDHLEKLILPLVGEYDRLFDYFVDYDIISSKKEIPLYLHDPWVNFQEMGEYNPVHRHSGVMTFVIWIDIPYTMADEQKAFDKNIPGSRLAGTFNLMYSNAFGRLSQQTFPADKSFNNKILIFPSELSHCVYPFYSTNQYRISVSGNFKLKID